MKTSIGSWRSLLIIACLLLIMGTSLSCTAGSTQIELVDFNSQFHKIELQYPMDWTVEEVISGIEVNDPPENDLVTIVILPDPDEFLGEDVPDFLEEDLAQSLRRFTSGDPFYGELILAVAPIQAIDFNGHNAAQTKLELGGNMLGTNFVAADARMLLVETQNGRVLIIVETERNQDSNQPNLDVEIGLILDSIQFE